MSLEITCDLFKLERVEAFLRVYTLLLYLIEHEHAHAAALTLQHHIVDFFVPLLLGLVGSNEARRHELCVRAHNSLQE